ncbi:hypothetical protein [Leptodesmis sichuanensis]|uniref:hypothetical protein n=1 Tax=Leptodesmis sichuanensis TaxID=2906798 RepID=UPI001F37CE7F|nr:hypothetical protein [Leptodesmis sichuanensis]UIE38681.1 hypothetical protein KIK02_03345 [Leptodesmis sichuanensis A121]
MQAKFVQPLLQQAKEQGQQELDQQQQAIAQNLLAEHNQRLLEYLQTLNLPKKYFNPIETFLQADAQVPFLTPPYLHPTPAVICCHPLNHSSSGTSVSLDYSPELK